MGNCLKNKFFISLLFFISINVRADVDYTQDALRFDTVLPTVDYPETVLNKKIVFDHRFDLSVYKINMTDELFYNNSVYSIKAGYHWDDFYAAGFMYSSWEQGLNEYSEIFKNSPAKLDFARAAAPEKSFSVYFESLYFYGKINLSRNLVLTNNFLGRYSIGVTQYAKEFLPLINYSLGYQTFFNKKTFFELGYGVSLQQIYNPISINIRSTEPVPEKTSFTKKIEISQNLNLGFGYLF